jgi:hypothetical protein
MNVGGVQKQARQGYRHARSSSSFEWLTRVGFFSKGIVFVLIGVLALMAAFGEGGQTTGQNGVIHEIAEKPFGEFALIVIGVGLLAYALWRIVTAFEDAEHHGRDAKGIAKRVGHAFAGIAYAGIAATALKLAIGESASRGDGTNAWTARLMDAPGGTILVMLAGLVILLAGLFQVRYGWREEFRKYLRTERNEWLIPTGKWGYMARGVVFAVMGLLIAMAGLRHDPNRARGLEGALDALASQAYGQWLLALAAAGLASYGVFSMLSAKYRRIE